MEKCCKNCKHWHHIGETAVKLLVNGTPANVSYGRCDVEVEVPATYFRVMLISAYEGAKCPFFEAREEE